MAFQRVALRFALTSLSLVVLAGLGLAADLPLAPAIDPMPAATLAPAALPYFVRLGVAAVIADTRLSARLAGAPVAGGDGSIGTVAAAAVEGGYYLTDTIAVSLAFGYPPTLTTRGTGALAPFGTLYRAVVGLPVLAATYHLDMFGAFRPYAGIGVGYAIVFRNEAVAIAAPNLRDRAAFVLVGGIDYALTDRWGVFVDVKKAFLTQRFSGLATPFPGGPALPVTASIRSDPLLVTSGVRYRF
jgi:outer membrane protein